MKPAFLLSACLLAFAAPRLSAQTSLALRPAFALFTADQTHNEFYPTGERTRFPISIGVDARVYQQFGQHFEVGTGIGLHKMMWAVRFDDVPIAEVKTLTGATTDIEPTLESAYLPKVRFEERYWTVPLTVRYFPIARADQKGWLYLSLENRSWFLGGGKAVSQFRKASGGKLDGYVGAKGEPTSPALAPEANAAFQRKTARYMGFVAPGLGAEIRLYPSAWFVFEVSYLHGLTRPHPFIEAPAGVEFCIGIQARL
ncbi:MAG: hypothetical protein ACK4Q5_16110 [Saprospiraceae bacterium]